MADELELFVKGDTEGEYVQYEQPTFTDQLPEDLKESETFKEVANVGDLAQRHVQISGELADLKSAQPTIPETYEVPDIPEEIKDDKAIEGFNGLAKELKLTQEQFNKIIEFDLDRADRYTAESKEAHEAMIAANDKILKERWGTKYDENKEAASSGLRKVLGAFKDGEDIEKELTESGFLDIPSVVRVFRKIGIATSEDVFTKADTPPGEDIPRGADGQPLLDYPSMRGKK